MLRGLTIAGASLLAAGLLAGTVSTAWAETEGDKAGDSKIWNGVYTAAQAERGKADFDKSCSNCHNADLNGGPRAPALRGDRFMRDWVNGSAEVLFAKVRDTMPANYPETVSDEIKIDILAYLLEQNAFPAGKTELKLDDKELEDIQIVPKGEQAAANFALVRMVGCLAEGPAGKGGVQWTLNQTTEPAITRDETATPASLQDAAAKPLGAGTYELVSAAAFKPDAHKGQKVEARGLLYRDAGRNVLNLTSLENAGSACN